MKSALATVMVSDMERSIAFYGATLGLEKLVAHPGWAEFAAQDGFRVALHDARPGTELPPKGGISVGFGVDDIDATRAKLEGAGVAFFGPTIDSGPVRLAFFGDPDGYPLYLAQETTPPA